MHHIAWRVRDDQHEAWREHMHKAGARPTPIIDRQYFCLKLPPQHEHVRERLDRTLTPLANPREKMVGWR